MQNQKQLETTLRNKFKRIATDKKLYEQLYNICKEKYNVEKIETANYLAGRRPLDTASAFMLYVLLDGVESCLEIKKSEIPVYFTEKEIKKYSHQVMQSQKKVFPIVFDNMIEVNEAQWIGKIQVSQILDLMNENLIRYNVETQRAITVILKNDGSEDWRITINRKSVEEITESMLDGTFISNMITLNILEDDIENDADFYYDEETHKFVIKKINALDVTDGFHRILAMQRCKSMNPDFDMTMEFRITNFSTNKARNFIRQEDLKTHMSRSQSRAMDTSDAANNIVERLMENPSSNFNGIITKFTGQIKYADIAEAIRKQYFTSKQYLSMSEKKIRIMQISKSLNNHFNALTERYMDLLGKTYDFLDLCVMIRGFYSIENEGKNCIEVYDEIYNLLKYLETYNKKKLLISTSRSTTNKINNAINTVKKEMYQNV